MPEETAENLTEEQPVEDAVEETEDQVDEDAEVDEDEDDAPENQDSVEYWKNKAKKNGNEAQNLRKRLRTAETELDPLKAAKLEAERKGMGELELAQSKVNELTEAVERLTRDGWLKDVEARWDLPERAKSFLTGTTAEEFMQAADDIAKDLGLERKDKTPRRTSAKPADLAGGRDAGKAPAPTLDIKIAEAMGAGEWQKAALLKTQKLLAAK